MLNYKMFRFLRCLIQIFGKALHEQPLCVITVCHKFWNWIWIPTQPLPDLLERIFLLGISTQTVWLYSSYVYLNVQFRIKFWSGLYRFPVILLQDTVFFIFIQKCIFITNMTFQRFTGMTSGGNNSPSIYL